MKNCWFSRALRGASNGPYLIIDDDELFRQMLRQMLETAGYEVAEAADGEQGVALFRASPAELVITDIFMPEKEGIATIYELRKDFPSLKIIAITGGGNRRRGFEYLEFREKSAPTAPWASPSSARRSSTPSINCWLRQTKHAALTTRPTSATWKS